MTDWEHHYTTRDTPWEKGVPHPALVEYLRTHPMPGRVLVPGCGYGHDVRAIAAAADEVVGFDIAAGAIEAARSHPEVGGESYVQGDLFALPVAWRGRFDWVFEHTCFCAIDPASRPDYVRSVTAALRPGGRLLAIFYLDPGLDPGETGPPFGISKEELDALFSPFFRLEKEWTPPATFPGREGGELCRLLLRQES
jgi:SAM-dependent methyltransferase